ncbi:C40 family peptidase [Kurthia sibirica]|uniref:Glycoside hydrolase n=1 Tax=Kurthia sibirica TaxID=202750 RepID=A0A2U3AMM5_9BACL|nr:SH3 domain-containing C40 family peptidase [Kurthia sibirica]PWI25772.1 glycoside hydrolase [Kurthia sibirica]GEK35114.1 peptidase P60 [Kurthia sibirica]
MLKKLIISTIATGAIALSAAFGSTTDASAATQQNYSATKYVKSYDGTLNLRSSASVKGKLVGTVKNGAKVKTTAKKTVSGTTWVKGTVSGKTGWMNANYLTNNKVKKASASHSGLISYGAQFRGTPYVWGGTTPRGFDCSGFTSYVYKNAAGKTIPRTSGAQYAASKKISRSQLQAGDLVFFSAGGGRVTHVALYAGNGQLLHAAGNSVKYQSLAGYWSPLVVGYGRF